MLNTKPIPIEVFDASSRMGLRVPSVYLFEERSGVYIADSITGVPGIFEGSLSDSSWSESPYGGGLGFSGASDRVKVAAGETAFFSPYYPISGIVIFYLNQLPSSAGRSFDLFVRYDGSGNKLVRLFVDSADDECKLSVDGVATSNVSTGGNALTSGGWNIVHFQVDEAFGNLKVWVDGELDSSSDFSDTALSYGDGVLYIGGDGATGTTGLDGVIAFLCFNLSEIDDAYVVSTYFDPFVSFRVEANEGDTLFSTSSVAATFDQQPQLIARYGSKEGLDLINDYGLEEMEVGQEPNLQQSTAKGVHGASVKGGALGEKKISLRGVIEETSQELCYYKLNRLSAHIKLLMPAAFWVWDDRMIYSIGGDLTWSFIQGSGGKSASWSATLICTDPFFSNTASAEWQTPVVVDNTGNVRPKYTNKGNAPTWPVIVLRADVPGQNAVLPLTIINESIDPNWELYIAPPFPFSLYYRSPTPDEVVIDCSVREVIYTPGSGSPYEGKVYNWNQWIKRGDFIWLEGGPKGRESQFRYYIQQGYGTVFMLLRSQWY